MQGNCEGAEVPELNLPSGHAPLRDMQARQCLLLADAEVMDVNGSLWLDSLYMRLTAPRDEDGEFLEFIDSSTATEGLYMTGVTLQGNGDGVQDCFSCAIFVDSSAVYAEGA